MRRRGGIISYHHGCAACACLLSSSNAIERERDGNGEGDREQLAGVCCGRGEERTGEKRAHITGAADSPER